jgi:hypothetical protein
MCTGEVPERSKGTDCKSVGEAFGGSNPPLPIMLRQVLRCRAGIAQLARASAFQAEGRGFESRFPLFTGWYLRAHVAQAVEHFLGKEEVIGSSPIVGFIFLRPHCGYSGDATPSYMGVSAVQ